MGATEKQTNSLWLFNSDVILQKLPTFLQIFFGTCKFEVINVNHEIKLQDGVKVGRRPSGPDRLKTRSTNTNVTMLFPKGPAVRVTIQGLH